MITGRPEPAVLVVVWKVGAARSPISQPAPHIRHSLRFGLLSKKINLKNEKSARSDIDPAHVRRLRRGDITTRSPENNREIQPALSRSCRIRRNSRENQRLGAVASRLKPSNAGFRLTGEPRCDAFMAR
jgi:hypothetical protein